MAGEKEKDELQAPEEGVVEDGLVEQTENDEIGEITAETKALLGFYDRSREINELAERYQLEESERLEILSFFEYLALLIEENNEVGDEIREMKGEQGEKFEGIRGAFDDEFKKKLLDYFDELQKEKGEILDMIFGGKLDEVIVELNEGKYLGVVAKLNDKILSFCDEFLLKATKVRNSLMDHEEDIAQFLPSETYSIDYRELINNASEDEEIDLNDKFGAEKLTLKKLLGKGYQLVDDQDGTNYLRECLYRDEITKMIDEDSDVGSIKLKILDLVVHYLRHLRESIAAQAVMILEMEQDAPAMILNHNKIHHLNFHIGVLNQYLRAMQSETLLKEILS